MNHEASERRYQETMQAIDLWLKGQRKAMLPAEALGIARALLTHASLAIVAATSDSTTFSKCDEIDADRLRKDFFHAALQFVEEKKRDRDGL